MADNLKYTGDLTPTSKQQLATDIDEMIRTASSLRMNFERKWYDNNFFDDGYHFRYVSRTTGKIIDASDSGVKNMSPRAIPKASRQIRGIANLLVQPDYVPVVYPDEMTKMQDEEKAKDDAKKAGIWLEDKWDDLKLKTQLIYMALLAMKNSVSFMKIWKDDKERINAVTRDAFDVYLMGNVLSIEDSPFIVEATPKLISEIKSNPNFDEEAVKRINPDNKYASSEIKEAYLKATYGSDTQSDYSATLIQKEAFIKTRVTRDNKATIYEMTKDRSNIILELGDTVIRHVFSAGGEVLMDEFLMTSEYPYVDLRLEPGAVYQVPMIERFIPANKSLDLVVSRLERYANTMVTGTWLKRKGEDFDIGNIAGGQVLEYKTTPPVQAQLSNVPPFMFNFISLLESLIEEQGASTSALGNVPPGVKSGVAIESLKATEYANLKIASTQMQECVARIGKKMLKIGSELVYPQQVRTTDEKIGTFNVIGSYGAEARNKLNIGIPQNTVVLSDDMTVDVEVQTGLGFTMEGKKESMQQIATFMSQLMQQGLISQEAVGVVTEKLLETYQFGATQEFMSAMKEGTMMAQTTNEDVEKIKVAVLEVLKDAGLVGPENDQRLIDSTKTGVAEVMTDLSGSQPQPQ